MVITGSRIAFYRLRRLIYLISLLLQLVDDIVLKDKRESVIMRLKSTVGLSHLAREEQKLIYLEITYENLISVYAQAIEIKELCKEKNRIILPS